MVDLHMRRGPMALNRLAVVSVVLLSACIGDDRADRGRGSESCRIWQDTACDHFADACGAVDRAICDQQYQSVTCRSDKLAQSCTKMLRSVTCGGASPDCLLGDVADPDPAKAACTDLADSFCERSVECGFESDKQACLDSTASFLPCSRAVGFQLSFETCLGDIEKADCSALTLPLSCDSVIIARGDAAGDSD
jgi:hypothetical protein